MLHYFLSIVICMFSLKLNAGVFNDVTLTLVDRGKDKYITKEVDFFEGRNFRNNGKINVISSDSDPYKISYIQKTFKSLMNGKHRKIVKFSERYDYTLIAAHIEKTSILHYYSMCNVDLNEDCFSFFVKCEACTFKNYRKLFLQSLKDIYRYKT